MSDENKKKLNEQLVRCVLDDKLSNDKKIKKIDYIVKLGGDINAECSLGYSLLGLAKMMQNDDVISFLEEKGAKDIGFNRKKAEKFFRTASVEEMNDVLKVLPDGYMLMCDVNLNNRGLEKLPDFSKLIVAGYFDCSGHEDSDSFTLDGAPKVVVSDFYCNYCALQDLQGCPKIVGGDFKMIGNSISSLKGAPEIVNGSFDCSSNVLESLEGAPKKIGKSFNCSWNKLESLEGAPREVGDAFDCKNNPLKSYKGKPDKIGRVFIAPDIEIVGSRNGGIDR